MEGEEAVKREKKVRTYDARNVKLFIKGRELVGALTEWLASDAEVRAALKEQINRWKGKKA